MLRTCGRKLIVAMALAAALAWLGAGPAAAQAPQKTPLFARVALSEKNFVYLQIQGHELRAAMSIEGLQTATPVKSLTSMTAPLFPEFTLPLPADQLPAGVTAIKARMALQEYQVPTSQGTALKKFISGQVTLCRTDDQKVAWQYVANSGAEAAADAEKAQSIGLPDLDHVKAVVLAKPANGKLGIGLRLMAGDIPLTDVFKNRRPVQAKMTVTDAAGAEKASKTGSLAAFGFS
jgi:hypothetical protein